MNKKILIGAAVMIFAVAGYVAFRVLTSRQLSPSQTITYSYERLDLTVVYCRPFKKGRMIFGEKMDSALVPNGQYWRLGANEATEITFSKDANFAGKAVKAGSYRMYAVPNASSWMVSLNSELGKWGYDEPNYDLDVLKVDVPVETVPTVVEQFTITFSNDSAAVNMDLTWDRIHLRIPITIQ